jgi:hypothetical protein
MSHKEALVSMFYTFNLYTAHQGPNCVPEKVGINQKGINKKYSQKKKDLNKCNWTSQMGLN